MFLFFSYFGFETGKMSSLHRAGLLIARRPLAMRKRPFQYTLVFLEKIVPPQRCDFEKIFLIFVVQSCTLHFDKSSGSGDPPAWRAPTQREGCQTTQNVRLLQVFGPQCKDFQGRMPYFVEVCGRSKLVSGTPDSGKHPKTLGLINALIGSMSSVGRDKRLLRFLGLNKELSL